MDLLPDEEQSQIADAARNLLADRWPIAKVHALPHTGAVVDQALWKNCAAQGWFGLSLPEAQGGVGYGLAEETLLFRELGRHLVPGPFIGTVVATHLAAHAGDTQTLGRLISGEVTAGIAVPAPNGGFVTYDAEDSTLLVLLDGAAALIPASTVTPHPKSCFDRAARRAEFTVDRQATNAVPRSGYDGARHAVLLVSAMLSGIAEAARDASAGYAKVRKQFGTPIGAYQAVKHRCADAAVRADAATHLTSLAALSAGSPDADLLAASALRIAAEAALRNAADNIQNHGGIGITAEADAHLYLKRAHVLTATLGDAPLGEQALLDRAAG